ncbi:unnamed protein product [Rhizoctonia solani]|uniref:HMG box domain-containing protein n=1 Tax=Rhizoctonia solani TaxID=456999 RepID=A0A8H2WB64_9AGAM|nr:unnamed protein product [Rhizoctonia solani]
MPPSRTSSTKRPSNKLPFTVDSIKDYEPFMMLDPTLKAKICELLSDGMINPKGNIKRPQNSYILYRQKCSPELAEQRGDKAGGSSEPKPTIVKNEWKQLEGKRGEYKEIADRVRQEHCARFPGYKFTPISERKWGAINEEGRKKWVFEPLSFIGTKMLHCYSGAKPHSLDIDEWIRDPSNHKYVTDQILKEVQSKSKTSRRSRSGDPSANQSPVNPPLNNTAQPPTNSSDTHSVDNAVPHEHSNITLPTILWTKTTICPRLLDLASGPLPDSIINTTANDPSENPTIYSGSSDDIVTDENYKAFCYEIGGTEYWWYPDQSMSQPSDRGELDGPRSTESDPEPSREHLEELMKQFLNLSEFEDIDESGDENIE